MKVQLTQIDFNLTLELTPNACQAHRYVSVKHWMGETQKVEVEGLSKELEYQMIC